MAEWLKATDCKSVLSGVRRFETYSAHNFYVMKMGFMITSGSSSFGRAVAFQASGGRFEPGLPLIFIKTGAAVQAAYISRRSSGVEHPDTDREGQVSSISHYGSIHKPS